MSKWMKVAVITVVAVALPILAASQDRLARVDMASKEESVLRVVRDLVTTGVVNREPVNDGMVFSARMGPVFYFTELEATDTPTHVAHVWYYDGQQMAEVHLSIDGPRWRTWSSKQIIEGWKGSWRVEAVDPDGKVLSYQTFEVQ